MSYLTESGDEWRGWLDIADDMFGMGGDDKMWGAGGDDFLDGGGGNDKIWGESGDDRLYGSSGDDMLAGGAGWDHLDGGVGNDSLFLKNRPGDAVGVLVIQFAADANFDEGGFMNGDDGNDMLYVDVFFTGHAAVDGGADSDTVDFTYQSNSWQDGVPASVATNLLDLESANGETPFGGTYTVARVENITGGEYRDEFYGDDGANILRGMANNDVLEGRRGADTLDGGSGHDVASYRSSPGWNGTTLGVDIDLLRETQLFCDAAGDRLISIEEVRGSAFRDVIRGTNAANEVFSGDNGDDTLEGRGGADTLDGGAGFDFASYESSGAVNVMLPRPGFTPAQIGSHAAGDTLISIEGLIGSAFGDTLTGNDERNELRGGDGVEVLSGFVGTDTLLGGAHNDTLDGGYGNDTIDGGGDFDTASFQSWNGTTIAQSIRIELGLNGADGIAEMRSSREVLETDVLRSIENVKGSNLGETIKGNEQRNNLHGGGGQDRLEGGGNNDTLNGGLGQDTLVGGAGFDFFLFDTVLGAGNVDSILDYSVVEDTIYLDNSVFTALPAVDMRTLSPSEFWVGTAAHDASDRIIYNSNSGALLYDRDGTGSAAAVQFATLNPFLNVTDQDFIIV